MKPGDSGTSVSVFIFSVVFAVARPKSHAMLQTHIICIIMHVSCFIICTHMPSSSVRREHTGGRTPCRSMWYGPGVRLNTIATATKRTSRRRRRQSLRQHIAAVAHRLHQFVSCQSHRGRRVVQFSPLSNSSTTHSRTECSRSPCVTARITFCPNNPPTNSCMEKLVLRFVCDRVTVSSYLNIVCECV